MTNIADANTLQSDWLVTRAFEGRDLGRLLTWGAMDTPEFFERDAAKLPAPQAARAARAFLDAADPSYVAVCYRADQASRNAGRMFEGPLAALRTGFNGVAECVYVDPSLRANTAFMQQLEHMLSRQAVPQLVAA